MRLQGHSEVWLNRSLVRLWCRGKIASDVFDLSLNFHRPPSFIRDECLGGRFTSGDHWSNMVGRQTCCSSIEVVVVTLLAANSCWKCWKFIALSKYRRNTALRINCAGSLAIPEVLQFFRGHVPSFLEDGSTCVVSILASKVFTAFSSEGCDGSATTTC